MDISFYFSSLNDAFFSEQPYTLGQQVKGYVEEFPDWLAAEVVIVGVPLGERSKSAVSTIRKQLYTLASTQHECQIVDLGNIWIKGDEVQDFNNIAHVVQTLVRAQKTVLLIGGDQTLSLGQFMGYDELNDSINITTIDNQLDIKPSEWEVTTNNVYKVIFLHENNNINNFSNIGLQVHWAAPQERRIMDDLKFDYLRLSEVRDDFKVAEPILRWSDMVVMDMSATRSSDAPHTLHPCPAGFTAEEMCRLARYAGVSSMVTSFSVTNVDAEKDVLEQSASVAALCLWYFLDGFCSRWSESVNTEDGSLIKYMIASENLTEQIIFYKHPVSERWWMALPKSEFYHPENNQKTVLIPCSEKDYLDVLRNDIPKRWWNALHKIKNQ